MPFDATSREAELLQVQAAITTATQDCKYWRCVNYALNMVRKQFPQFSIWAPGPITPGKQGHIVVCDKFQNVLKNVPCKAKADP